MLLDVSLRRCARVTWEIWKHRNTIVFEGARLNIQTVSQWLMKAATGVLVVPLLSMSSSLGVWALTVEGGRWAGRVCVP